MKPDDGSNHSASSGSQKQRPLAARVNDMKITVDNESTLQIEEQNTIVVMFALVLFASFIFRLGYLLFQYESNTREYIGVIIGLAVSFFGGNAFSEKVTFQFRRSEKMIKWSRKKLMGEEKSGWIPFQDISNVYLASIGRGQGARYRIEMVCHNEVIPISSVYSQGNKDKHDQIVERIVEYIKI